MDTEQGRRSRTGERPDETRGAEPEQKKRKKEKRQKKEKPEKKKGRIRSNPVVRILVRVVALVVTILLVVGAVYLVVNRDKISVDSVRRWWSYRSASGETSDQFSLAGQEYTSLAPLEKGVIACGGQGFWVYNRSGELVLGEQVTLEQPVLSVAGKFALVYDAGGSELYVISQEQEVYHYTSEDGHALLSARVNEDGWLTLVEDATGYKASVTVYSAAYQPQITVNISSSFITDAAVSYDEKQVVLVSVGEDESGFDTQLLFYSVSDGEEVHRCNLGNEVVLDLDWEKSQLWVTGQYGAYCLVDGSVTASYTENAQYLQGLTLAGDGYAAVVFSKYQNTGVGSLSILLPEGTLHSVGLSESLVSLSAAGRYLAVLTASNLTIYTSDLTVYASVDNSWSARKVMMRSDGSALLVSGDTVNLYLPD